MQRSAVPVFRGPLYRDAAVSAFHRPVYRDPENVCESNCLQEWEARGVDVREWHENYCADRCEKRQCEMDFLEPCYGSGFAGELWCNERLRFDSGCPTRLRERPY